MKRHHHRIRVVVARRQELRHAEPNLFEQAKRLGSRRHERQSRRMYRGNLVLQASPLEDRQRQHVEAGLNGAGRWSIGFAVHEHAIGDNGQLGPDLDFFHVRGNRTVIVRPGETEEPGLRAFGPADVVDDLVEHVADLDDVPRFSRNAGTLMTTGDGVPERAVTVCRGSTSTTRHPRARIRA